MDEVVNGFTGFAHRKATDGPRYAEPTEDEKTERPEPKKFDPEELKRIPAKDRHWSWVEVDLGAIKQNVATLKHRVEQRMILANVAADGFGHGAVEVAKAALQAGAEYIGVATVDEGIRLREGLVNAPILVLSQPPHSAIPLLLGYMLEPSISSAEFAIEYGEAADAHGVRAPYHLVMNTGMNNIGVHYSEALQLVRQIEFHRALQLKGIYTYLATTRSPDPEGLDLTMQLQRFEKVIAEIHAAGINPGIVHAADSAGAIRSPRTWFDMVRIGSALYGLHACDETFAEIELAPAMSVRARIVDVKVPPMGEGVSYNMERRCTGKSIIGTLPLGFADGLPRTLAEKMEMLYGGQRVSQVGAIMMDHCMFECPVYVRIHQQPLNPQVGDEVVLVGRQGTAEITLDELARRAHVANYELACMLGNMRLPRVYARQKAQQGKVVFGI